MLENFRVVTRFRVPFGDVDMLRHANNIAYLRWIEQQRTDYMHDVLGEDSMWGRGIILARLTADYERQIAYRENIAVGCRVSRIGSKSFDFVHEVWSDDQAERCALITATVVAMDYASEATIVVPQAWRERIAAFECEPVAGAGPAGSR